MLLLLTFLAVGVVGLVISRKTNDRDVENVAGVTSMISFIFLAICFIFLGVKALGEGGAKAKMQAKHDTIIQMMEEKSNVVTLTRDISEYNGEILSGRELRKSPWIGIFVYDFYDDFMTIEVGHLEHVR